MRLLFVFTISIVLAEALNIEKDPMSDEFIAHINHAKTSWRAGKNFAPGVQVKNLKKRLGVPADHRLHRPPIKKLVLGANVVPTTIKLPYQFDLRRRYPNCTSIGRIYDQGECGSCWAVSAARAMTDRICIASNGQKNIELSPQNLLACCDDCGLQCMGGYPAEAWDYWVKSGIVSGGAYGSNVGCQPYEIGSCGSTVVNSETINCPDFNLWPDCYKKCSNSNYTKSYYSDLNFGLTSYAVEENERKIQEEIYTKGTVQATFDVYSGFLTYKSGIYSRVSNYLMGAHAVRVIGWGVSNNIKYWLCANAWGTSWGENGLFRIKRGTDECGIESDILAGIPKV